MRYKKMGIIDGYAPKTKVELNIKNAFKT